MSETSSEEFVSMVPARRTLTDHEDKAIGRLLDTLDKHETVSSFSGAAECSADRLLYRTAKKSKARTLHFRQEASVATAFKKAEVSLHGISRYAEYLKPPLRRSRIASVPNAALPDHGGETVYDETVHKAREIKSDRLFLPEPLYALATSSSSQILASIAAATALGNIRAQLDKVTIYAEGGFFAAHRDKPKANGHIGTLLIALPFTYEGGVLSVRHDDREVNHDWRESMAGKLHWSFLFADTLHEVLPVTSGHRVALSFHVSASAEKDTPALNTAVLDVSSTPFLQDLQKLLADETFLKEGGKLAFALSHKYPVAKAADHSFSALFKGSDRLLIQALNEADLAYEIVAIYKPDQGESESPSDDSDGWPKDERISWMTYWKEWEWSDHVAIEEGPISVSTMLYGLYADGFTPACQFEDISELWESREMVLDKSLICEKLHAGCCITLLPQEVSLILRPAIFIAIGTDGAGVRYPVHKTWSSGLPYLLTDKDRSIVFRNVTVGVVVTVPPMPEEREGSSQCSSRSPTRSTA